STEPSPTSTVHSVVNEVSAPANETAPADTSVTVHPTAKPTAVGGEVMDPAIVALVHANAAGLTPDDAQAASGTSVPPAVADGEAVALTLASTAALPVPLVAEHIPDVQVHAPAESPPQRTGLWAPWVSALASGLSSSLALYAGTFAIGAKPLV